MLIWTHKTEIVLTVKMWCPARRYSRTVIPYELTYKKEFVLFVEISTTADS